MPFTIVRILLLTTVAATHAAAATYNTTVQGTLHLPDPIPGVLTRTGLEGIGIGDVFDPILLEGNAGFEGFAIVESFLSGVLGLRFTGPSGFAHPAGRSVGGAEWNSLEILLANLTDTALSVSMRLDYSYSLSATAGAGESALARLGLDVLMGEIGGQRMSIFNLSREILSNGSEQDAAFVDLSVILGPQSVTAFSLLAETRGEASAIPEPGTALTLGVGLLLLMRIK